MDFRPVCHFEGQDAEQSADLQADQQAWHMEQPWGATDYWGQMPFVPMPHNYYMIPVFMMPMDVNVSGPSPTAACAAEPQADVRAAAEPSVHVSQCLESVLPELLGQQASTAASTANSEHWPSESAVSDTVPPSPAVATAALPTTMPAPGQGERRRRRPVRVNAPTVPLRAVGPAPVGVVATSRHRGAKAPVCAQDGEIKGDDLFGKVVTFAFDAAGSRIVQRAVQELGQQDAARIAGELRGHVRAAVESPHANYVLSCCIEQLPASSVSWIVEELLGAGVAAARHRYGCRVICRLMEHHPLFAPGSYGTSLVNEIVEAAVQLARNEFGRHTVIKLLEQGTDERRSQVVEALMQDLIPQARHRNASYVVEAALEHAPDSDRVALVRRLLVKEDLLTLAQCQSGCHVIRSLLHPNCGCSGVLLKMLAESAPLLRDSKYGQLLLNEQGLLGHPRAGM